MPTSIVAAIVGAYVAEAVVVELAFTAFTAAVVRAVVGVVVSGIVRSAMGESSNNVGSDETAAAVSDPVITSRNRTVTIRQAISPWQVIYGQARVGGTITYAYTSTNVLALVITLAGHVSQEIGDVYFGDEVVPLDGAGAATGRFAGYVTIIKSLGAESGQPFAALVTATGGEWSDAHRQTGHTKICVILNASSDLFSLGVPNITAVVKGRKVVDPRFSPTEEAYSNNVALCANDYLTNTRFGIGASYSTEINETQLVSAANSCDEAVTLASAATEARYCAGGAFKLDAIPSRVLGLLLGAMFGKAVNVGGKWSLFAGVYEVPTITLDEGDLAAPIRVQSLLSRRENANGVKGLFTDPLSSWQATSFPALASTSYKVEDNNERIWMDLDLSPFVTSGTQAQRLAKISLLSLRQGLTAVLKCKLTAWRAMTGRTVAVTNTKFGWTAKAFEIAGSSFVFNSDGTLGVELSLRESASAIYDWATSEEQSVDIAPNSTLPDPFSSVSLSGLTATSGTADLFRQGDGTIVPRVRLRWTQPTNPFVAWYDIEFATTASPTEWVPAPTVNAPASEGFAYPVKDGINYDLRVRAVTGFGNSGSWSYVYNHMVIGKTEVPSDVTGASVSQAREVVSFACATVTDEDLDSIEIRLLDYSDTTWLNGIPVANILRGQAIANASIPPGNWTFLFKAKDTSGNYSANAARVDFEVDDAAFTFITSREDSPDWVGEIVGFVVSVSNALVPKSSLAANAHTKAELWEQYVPYPIATATYTAPEIDELLDLSSRVYADIVSTLGRGVTSGQAAPQHQVDYRTSAGSYDGFENWNVGTATFRYLKSRILSASTDTDSRRIKITGFLTALDSVSRTEEGSYSTPAGGSVAVVFANVFHSAPTVLVSPQGSGNVSASFDNVTASGFTGYFKTAGAASTGTASYRATGA